DDQGNVTYSNRPPQPHEAGPPTPESKTTPESKAAPESKITPESKPAAPETKAPEVKAPEIKSPEPTRSEVKAPEVPATPIPKGGPTKVDELLELSGIRAQLAGLLGRVALDLRPPPGQMSAAEMATIDRILAQSLKPEAVYAAVRDAFRPLVDRPNLEATAAWLRAPVARKIVALEIASSESSAEPNIAEYAATIK